MSTDVVVYLVSGIEEDTYFYKVLYGVVAFVIS